MINGQLLLIDGKPVYPYEDSPVNTGRIPGTTNFIPNNPLPLTRQLLDRGQQRYQINCLPCHGPAGDGKGITSKYNMFSMANFHDQRLVNMPDGEIFNTITYGKNLMGAYGAECDGGGSLGHHFLRARLATEPVGYGRGRARAGARPIQKMNL